MNLSTEPGPSKTQQQRLQDLAGRFQKAWEAVTTLKDAPDLSAFMPLPEDSLREDALQRLIEIDLEMRWRRSQPTYVEGYVERFRELGTAPKLLIYVLFAEYRIRHQHGDKP